MITATITTTATDTATTTATGTEKTTRAAKMQQEATQSNTNVAKFSQTPPKVSPNSPQGMEFGARATPAKTLPKRYPDFFEFGYSFAPTYEGCQ